MPRPWPPASLSLPLPPSFWRNAPKEADCSRTDARFSRSPSVTPPPPPPTPPYTPFLSRAGELQALLDKLRYRQGVDVLLSVGDLVNKGPDSEKVRPMWRQSGCTALLVCRCMSGMFCSLGQSWWMAVGSPCPPGVHVSIDSARPRACQLAPTWPGLDLDQLAGLLGIQQSQPARQTPARSAIM